MTRWARSIGTISAIGSPSRVTTKRSPCSTRSSTLAARRLRSRAVIEGRSGSMSDIVTRCLTQCQAYVHRSTEGVILRYGGCMATRKVTITLSEELIEALGAAAREDHVPLSRLVASAAESELRRRAGRRLIAEWQAEHGAFTAEELAAARAEMAAADAEALKSAEPA